LLKLLLAQDFTRCAKQGQIETLKLESTAVSANIWYYQL